jgi:uncharacterized protein (TIGR02172 family)
MTSNRLSDCVSPDRIHRLPEQHLHNLEVAPIMINIRKHRTDDHVELEISGRLDASAAPDLATALAAETDMRSLTLDLDDCSFVSSGGIREILTAHKRFTSIGGRVSLKNVQPDVWRVLELTGLTRMMDVREKLREISADGLEYLAEGVFGEVFRIDDETVVKLYREGVDPTVVEKEKRYSRAAFIAGIPTAISFDVVTSGNRFGIAYELLNAESLATRMRREPERLEDHARLLATLARKIHVTEADPEVFPDMKADAAIWIDDLAPQLAADDVAMLKAKLAAIPEATTCVHFDLHGGNVMVQGDDPIVIDMGDFSRGSPLFDLGLIATIYSPVVGICEAVTKIPNEIGARFLEHFLDHYFDGLPSEERDRFERDRPFLASLRLLHSVRLLGAQPDFRDRIWTAVTDRLIPAMR